MKVLRFSNWLTERMSINPITRAELEKTKQNHSKKEKLSFDKSCITCGTIVMFRDKTLGVYVDKDIAKEITNFFHLGRPYEYKYFLCVQEESNHTRAYICIDSFKDDLLHKNDNNEVDIIRIYTDPLTIDEIKTLENNDFYPILLDFAKYRSYIKRD